MLRVHIITDKVLRDLWFHSHTCRGRKGYYAYGAKRLKCFKTPKGYRIRNYILPKDTPIYNYGYPTSEPLQHRHGPYVFKCQLPGATLPKQTSIEEEIFPYSDRTLKRSTKTKLKVRCGKTFYRIVLLDIEVKTPLCYIFGTNIKVQTHIVPSWMRRHHVTLPHPARNVRKIVRSADGTEYHTGKPKVGIVYIAGIRMRCTAIGQLCSIQYKGRKYYAHASVTFNYKQYKQINK